MFIFLDDMPYVAYLSQWSGRDNITHLPVSHCERLMKDEKFSSDRDHLRRKQEFYLIFIVLFSPPESNQSSLF